MICIHDVYKTYGSDSLALLQVAPCASVYPVWCTTLQGLGLCAASTCTRARVAICLLASIQLAGSVEAAATSACHQCRRFAELLAESQERRRRIRALRTPGCILEPQPSSPAQQPLAPGRQPSPDGRQSSAELEQQPSPYPHQPSPHGQQPPPPRQQPSPLGKSDPALSAALVKRLDHIAAAEERSGDDGVRSGSSAHGSGARRGSDSSSDGSAGDTPGTPPNAETATATAQPESPMSDAAGGGKQASSTAQTQGGAYHPYSCLVAGVQWPAGVNPANRERHLSEADFRGVLGMARSQYDGLPVWKRDQLKKQKSLF